MDFAISVVARPAVEQMFRTLTSLTVKGAELAEARDIEEAVLLNWRLAPDMFPLAAQFQLATEIPARGLARLAGADLPSFEDEEASFEELSKRIESAAALIAALADADLDAEPDADITVPMGPQEMTMPRRAFLQGFVLPNLYFHTTAAYLILRQLGVDVGKRDFLAAS